MEEDPSDFFDAVVSVEERWMLGYCMTIHLM